MIDGRTTNFVGFLSEKASGGRPETAGALVALPQGSVQKAGSLMETGASCTNVSHEKSFCPCVSGPKSSWRTSPTFENTGCLWGSHWVGQKCILSKRILTSLTSIIKTEVFGQVHFLKQIGKFTFRFQAKVSFSLSSMLLLLLSRFSCVRLYATPEMAIHQAPLSMGFSRQEHRSGLPLPSPVI